MYIVDKRFATFNKVQSTKIGCSGKLVSSSFATLLVANERCTDARHNNYWLLIIGKEVDAPPLIRLFYKQFKLKNTRIYLGI